MARWQSLKQAPLTVPLLLFIAATIISTIVGVVSGPAFSGDGSHQLGRELKDCFANIRAFWVYFFAYMAFTAGPSDKVQKNALTAFVATGAVAGLWGTVQQVCNFHPFSYQYLQGTGFFSAPMPFAGLMQLSSFLCLGLLAKKGYESLPGPFKIKTVFALVTAANFLGLFFACERSAWLGMIAGLALAALRLSPRLFWQTTLAGVMLLGLAWATVPVVQARLNPLLHWQQDVSVTTRLKVWQRAVDVFASRPLTGVGPAHFPRITDIPEALVPGHSSDLNHAHSNYFQILSTLGILGSATFIFLLYAACRIALANSAIVDDNLAAGTGLGVFAALVSLMVAGIFEYNFGSAMVRLAEWFVLAMLKSSAGSSSSTDSAPSPENPG